MHPEGENLRTRINYSPVVETALPVMEMLAISAIGRHSAVTEIPALNALFEQNFTAFFSGAVLSMMISHAYRSRGDWATTVRIGFSTLALIQLYNLYSNSGDLTKVGVSLAIFGTGMGSFFALRSAARGLYNSGATIPIYRALGVQDRRIQ